MKKVVFICDRCQKTITGKSYKAHINGIEENGDYSQENEYAEISKYDLCGKCATELKETIEKFVFSWPGGG